MEECRVTLAQHIADWQTLINNPNAEVYTVTRTETQNNSLHKGLRNYAEAFGDAGLDMRKVLKPEVDIPWTAESVKQFMFNPIAGIMFEGKTSSELSTTEIQQVWDVLNRHTGEKFGITIPWPDRFNGGATE